MSFVFGGQRNQKQSQDSREVQIPVSIPYPFNPMSKNVMCNSLQIFTNFTSVSVMWQTQRIWCPKQTGSRCTILELCKFQFWQFFITAVATFSTNCVTKIRKKLKLISVDFLLGYKQNRKWNSNFSEVQITCAWDYHCCMDRPKFNRTQQRLLSSETMHLHHEHRTQPSSNWSHLH